MTEETAPVQTMQPQSSDASIVNRLFDFFTSDKFYRTLPEPESNPAPPADPRIQSLESELSALKEQLAQLTVKPEPDPAPEPEPEPDIPFVAPTEPKTEPLNVGGDELKSWLKLADSGDRSLGDFYNANKDLIFDQLKRQLQEAN